MKNNTNEENNLLENIRSCRPEFEAVIKARLGIVMRRQKLELEMTVLNACKEFQCSPEEYLEKIKTCHEGSPWIERLISGVTICETYFFRDNNQMKLLNDVLLPEIIQKKRIEKKLSIRIWSAGCSSGEEIYSIAMMLFENIRDLPLWNIHLLGTDINTTILQKAINGQYNEWAMRSISPYFKEHYFFREDNKYILSEKISNLVDFRYLNLNENDYPSLSNGTNAQDLILCRNVLIYFEHETIKHVMEKFHKSLTPDGYLLLGASDPINREAKFFQHQQGMLFSRRELVKTDLKTATFSSLENKTPKEIQKNQINFSMPVSKKTGALDQVVITTLLKMGHWEKILKIVEQTTFNQDEIVILFNAKAMALANMGQLEKALTYCQKSLALDQTNKFTYFIYALVLAELNRSEDAENALRKTLFLDHQFVVGHFQLGLLLLKNKKEEAGIKCLQNAFMIAKDNNAAEIVPGSSGVSYGHLSEMLKHEMDLYKIGTNHYEKKS